MKLSAIKIILIIVGIGLISPIFVRAQSPKPSLQDLGEAFNLLMAVKKSNLPDKEKEGLEISTRQDAFNDIINLSLAEINSLIKKLKNLTGPERYLETLTDLENHYKNILNDINRDLTLDEIINLGRQFKIWREAIYQPKIDEITNFILDSYNQKIIAMASHRFQLIEADLEKIKKALSSSKWEQLSRLLEKAGASIEAARELNKDKPAAVAEKIKEAYFSFLDMSRLVKK